MEREISRRNNAIEKIVVSDTLRPEETAPWTETTRILPRAAALQEVAELKHGSGGDILVFGSATMWNELLQAGLVDELHVMVGPALLGSGTPAYVGRSACRFSSLTRGCWTTHSSSSCGTTHERVRRAESASRRVDTVRVEDIGTLVPASGGSAGRGSTSGAEWR